MVTNLFSNRLNGAQFLILIPKIGIHEESIPDLARDGVIVL